MERLSIIVIIILMINLIVSVILTYKIIHILNKVTVCYYINKEL
nr:ALPV-103 [Albatrosspox virus]